MQQVRHAYTAGCIPSPPNSALTITAASAVDLVPFQFDVLKQAHDLQFTG